MTDVIFVILGLFVALQSIYRFSRTKKPIKTAAAIMASGVISLIAASIILGLCGLGLAVNSVTVFVSAALGVGGVLLMIIVMFIV